MPGQKHQPLHNLEPPREFDPLVFSPHPPLLRNAVTLPNTPLATENTASPLKKHKQDANHALLARIRSLHKLDMRSPMLPRATTSHGLSPWVTHDDQTSLNTTRTIRTIPLRIYSLVPDAVAGARSYYNDFTTIDWARAFIHTNKFEYDVHHGQRHDEDGAKDFEPESPRKYLFVQKVYYDMGKWLLVAIVAFIFALIAFFIDKIEVMLVGLKHGYCKTNWFASVVSCCAKVPRTLSKRLTVFSAEECSDWVSWSSYFHHGLLPTFLRIDYVLYVALSVILAFLAGKITLTTKIPARLPTSKRKIFDLMNSGTWSFDEDSEQLYSSSSVLQAEPEDPKATLDSLTLYTAAGSGVPEVKTILSGFVIRRFLGSYTLFTKTIALILAIASGMALGKEGPYVHLATCVGNITSRLFPFINENDYLKKEILCASASSGVALAFGSPLGAVLFTLEEINHYLPSNQLFLIFFCAITSTLFLKFLNPYGTNKTVLFELNYTSDWKAGELVFFVIIGIAGGLFGAAFIKFTKWWPTKFRQTKLIKDHPLIEITIISLLTGLISFWNPYTIQSATELVLDLATSCSSKEMDSSLCPANDTEFITEIIRLFFAFLIKLILTFVTFGIKTPLGIYVPSLVVGALFGRLFAMCIQLVGMKFFNNSASINSICSAESNMCVDLGIYSMISAGAFMAGVTRMNITLVTILFELTSSYTYVLPIAIAIAVANWLGGLLEENSLYECLLIASDYPFMSPEKDTVDPYVSAKDLLSLLSIYPESTQQPEKSKLNSLVRDTERDRSEHSQSLNSKTTADIYLQQDCIDTERPFIDISNSPYVSSSLLKMKLKTLAELSLLDGCVALIKDSVCVGLLYFSELEFCLDKLQEFSMECALSDELYCKVFETDDYSNHLWQSQVKQNEANLEEILQLRRLTESSVGNVPNDYFNYGSNSEYLDFEADRVALRHQLHHLTSFTTYVETSPICINHDSPLALAHLIFDRIGTRTVILQRKGRFYGLLHKKAFVDFCRRPER